MDEILKRLGDCGIIPVVVIDDAKDAVPTAKALLAGGIDVMEITFRTEAAKDSIKAVAAGVPDMLVGAGTVLNVAQAKQAVEAGAKFIVSPGFDGEMVKWCVDNGVAVTPGCVTPSEIMAALKLGVNVVKFFPANVYGGLAAMKSLSAPFGKVKFIPTGGVNADNIGEYAAAPFVHAVGGSWVCAKADIAAGNFDKITALSKAAVEGALGFTLAHVGVNTPDANAADDVVNQLSDMFGFAARNGSTSLFSGNAVEVMKSMYYGKNGHIAFKTNNIERAAAYLAKKGFTVMPESAKYKDDYIRLIYLTDEVGGFAIHLIRK